MKPIRSMRKNLVASGLLAVMLGSTALAASASTIDDALIQRVGNVSYVSGGVGTESIDRLNGLAGQFNLKLVFALKSGAYLSDTRVVIDDAKGKRMVDTTSDGPWFLIRLPAGTYQLSATNAGKTEKRQTAVGTDKLKTVDFRWASE